MAEFGRFSPLGDEIHPWLLNDDLRPEGVIHDVQHDCLILHRTTVQLEGRLAAVLAHSDPLAFLHRWE